MYAQILTRAHIGFLQEDNKLLLALGTLDIIYFFST